ncbi:hypothetical protein [Photobacterium leiognathi]|uniref:hypothetical protein n=1 Tax=Photobacterium leiognathi TaxID=553611 RepID=UPI002982134E|nr:hypothetical protein [Photobacterium leiognathi]
MKNSDKVVMHKHFEMGRGKYKLVGIWSAPTSAVAESNPLAYQSMMDERPMHCKLSCDHCGTGIIHHFILEDEDHKLFSVGSSCIEKLGQYDLVTAAQKMEKERQRQLRAERAEIKRMEKHAQYKAELEHQRNRNNGLTDQELKAEARKQRELDNEKQYRELSNPIVALLKKAGGDFCREIARNMRNGTMPHGNAKRIVIEIMSKQSANARKNSQAYNDALPKMTDLFESVASEFEIIQEQHREFLHKSHGYRK